jgi:hypothetical protein
VSYLGYNLTRNQAPFTLDVFTGDATTGPFTLSLPKPLSVRELLVYIDGVIKHPTTHYVLTASGNLLFTNSNEPGVGTVINALHLSHPLEIKSPEDGSVSSAKLTGDLVTPGHLTVSGDLVVQGDTTTLSTATLDVEDKIITINKGETGAGVTGSAIAGIQVDRGTEDNINLQWREDDDVIELNADFVPSANATYDLGSADKQWKSLHVSGSTIKLGGMPIKKPASFDALHIPSLVIGTDDEVLNGLGCILSNDNGFLVGSGISSLLSRAGGTMTGAITLLPTDPIEDNSAARKKYVDKKAFIFGLIL